MNKYLLKILRFTIATSVALGERICVAKIIRQAKITTTENSDWFLVFALSRLSYIYAIDICAYAVMSNHCHVVLHVDQERAKAWSAAEVLSVGCSFITAMCW